MTNIRIGCSGYYYPQWKGSFYPASLPPSRWLEHYSSVFNTVEMNGTFYRQPKLADLKKNAARTPPDFTFSVKISRYITHVMKLKNAAPVISEFTNRIQEGLGTKFQKLLFQMPPTFAYTEENLETILENVEPSAGHVIELRHISWWNAQAIEVLRHYTLCNVSFPGLPEELIPTSPDFYMRMHGVPQLFKSSYTNVQLKSLASSIPSGLENCHVYFNNTYFDAGHRNALVMQEIMKNKNAKKRKTK